jgi:pimeloyl-ACP methyl ester carboxylesterase
MLREVNGTKLYCEVIGQGPETLFFSHGLLFHGGMWAAQLASLSQHYRCVIHDHRGQGKSSRSGGRDMDLLADDVCALVEQLGLGPVHFIGLSMGGFVGMRVAARRPDLVRSLVLLNTSADAETHTRKYRSLVLAVQLFGVRAVTSRVIPIMFGSSTLGNPELQPMVNQWKCWLHSLPRDVVAAVKGVIHRGAVVGELSSIRCPTLVVAGKEDRATPVAKSLRIAEQLPEARLEVLEGVGHMSALESPDRINALLRDFLAGVTKPA